MRETTDKVYDPNSTRIPCYRFPATDRWEKVKNTQQSWGNHEGTPKGMQQSTLEDPDSLLNLTAKATPVRCSTLNSPVYELGWGQPVAPASCLVEAGVAGVLMEVAEEVLAAAEEVEVAEMEEAVEVPVLLKKDRHCPLRRCTLMVDQLHSSYPHLKN